MPAVFTLSKDNSAIVCDREGRLLSTVYPPPTSKSIEQMTYCSYLDRVFALLATGTICIFNIHSETAVLEKLQYTNQLKVGPRFFSVLLQDAEGKKLTQRITFMTFVSVVPPKYDCEIFNEKNL